jgi:plastocyanin
LSFWAPFGLPYWALTPLRWGRRAREAFPGNATRRPRGGLAESTRSSIFVIFALAVGLVSAPAAFADHSEVTIVPVAGSGAPDVCNKTPEGCYTPLDAIVDVGGTVTFINTDTMPHTFTSGQQKDDDAGSVFGMDILMKDQSFTWTPDTTGIYDYFCQVHPWMVGTITVQEAGAEESSDSEMAHDDADMAHSMSDDAAMKMPDVHLVSADGSVHVHFNAETPAAGSMGHLNLAFKGARTLLNL